MSNKKLDTNEDYIEDLMYCLCFVTLALDEDKAKLRETLRGYNLTEMPFDEIAKIVTDVLGFSNEEDAKFIRNALRHVVHWAK